LGGGGDAGAAPLYIRQQVPPPSAAAPVRITLRYCKMGATGWQSKALRITREHPGLPRMARPSVERPSSPAPGKAHGRAALRQARQSPGAAAHTRSAACALGWEPGKFGLGGVVWAQRRRGAHPWPRAGTHSSCPCMPSSTAPRCSPRPRPGSRSWSRRPRPRRCRPPARTCLPQRAAAASVS